MTVTSDIALWDMKSAADILRIYQRYHDGKEFKATVISQLADPALERGMTWLLKHHLEQLKTPQSAETSGLILKQILKLSHWEAKLHVLQIMAWLTIAPQYSETVKAFINSALASDRKFLRAWGYSGFHVLATQYARYQAEATHLFTTALMSETAASVKVRIRRALKQGFPASPCPPP